MDLPEERKQNRLIIIMKLFKVRQKISFAMNDKSIFIS